MNFKLVSIIVTVLISISVLAFFAFRDPVGEEEDTWEEEIPYVDSPPTTQSRSVSDTVAIDLTKNALVYNSVPVLSLSEDELFNRRWYTVPGASFDGLRGLTLPDAFQFISNTFPQLTVRAVPIGEPISLEYRRDRVTVQYDAFNKRVISARIG